MRGTIMRLFPSKGYGFVRGEDGLTRFMHVKQVTPMTDFDRMFEGQRVEFTPVDGEPRGNDNGCRATEVRVVTS